MAMTSLARLSSFHDQLMTIQSEIRKIVAHISSTIMRTESERSLFNANFNCSLNSNNKYRARILKSLNPKVCLVNTTNVQPQLPKKKMQPRLRRKRNGVKKNIRNKIVNKVKEEEEGEGGQKEEKESERQVNNDVMEITSVQSNWENDDDDFFNDDDENDQVQNLSDNSFTDETKPRTRKRRIQSKFKIKSIKKPKLSELNETEIEGESESAPKPKKFKSKRVRIRDHVTDLGDGKFLYFQQWGFHLMESGDKFKCDTCDYECGFRKQKGLHIAGIMTLHIKTEHMIAETEYLKRIDESKFLYYGQYTFEKMELGYRCGQCLKIYPKVATVTHHIDKCHATGDFKCEKCSRSFRNKGVLRSHSCKRDPGDTCQILELEPGKFIYNGTTGITWNFELQNEKYHCSHCPVVRSKLYELGGHIRSAHDQPLNLVCDECGKSFNNKGSFEFHKNAHAVADQSYQCAECGRTYKHLMGLRSHQQLAHAAPKKRIRKKTEECDKCGQHFTSALTLRNHIQRIHEANVICPFCGKKCEDKSSLYQHQRTHTLAKRYFCDMCDAGFPQKWQLVRHKKGATHRKSDIPTSDQIAPAESLISVSISMDLNQEEFNEEQNVLQMS